MNDDFKIFISHLKDGKIERIERTLPPSFLEVEEPDLFFQEPVSVNGEAYLTNDSLVLHLDLATRGIMPCTICNESVPVNISIRGCYHIESLKNVKFDIFDMREVVRESVLLETPSFIECGKGHCPKRKSIAKYMKSSLNEVHPTGDEGYHPFRDVNLE